MAAPAVVVGLSTVESKWTDMHLHIRSYAYVSYIIQNTDLVQLSTPYMHTVTRYKHTASMYAADVREKGRDQVSYRLLHCCNETYMYTEVSYAQYSNYEYSYIIVVVMLCFLPMTAI